MAKRPIEQYIDVKRIVMRTINEAKREKTEFFEVREEHKRLLQHWHELTASKESLVHTDVLSILPIFTRSLM